VGVLGAPLRETPKKSSLVSSNVPCSRCRSSRTPTPANAEGPPTSPPVLAGAGLVASVPTAGPEASPGSTPRWAAQRRSSVEHAFDAGPHQNASFFDEDWAETFAVWMTGERVWRSEYKDWPNALEKLEYCGRVVAGLDRLGRPDTGVVADSEVYDVPADYFTGAPAAAARANPSAAGAAPDAA
jgi:hypothetical protein